MESCTEIPITVIKCYVLSNTGSLLVVGSQMCTEIHFVCNSNCNSICDIIPAISLAIPYVSFLTELNFTFLTYKKINKKQPTERVAMRVTSKTHRVLCKTQRGKSTNGSYYCY